jgi:tripartite-type tricarboxylate transporter receptor subunit TctC
MRRLLMVMVAALLGPASIGMAAAQNYPARAISIIVPFPAGGATDTLARFLAERMREPADGYTLSIGTSTTHMLTGGLYALQFDLLRDLEPIIQIGSEPLLFVGRKNLPADDLKGLIAYLRANPDKASAGIAGVGATGHLTGISFQKETGTRFQFVPYRGNAPAMQDLLAEQIDFMIEPSSNFKSLVAAGSVKPYAITGRARLPSSPNIPTADEAGLPGFFASLWYGLWVPKDTPKGIIARLNATMVQVLADPSGKSASRSLASRSRRSRSNQRKRCARFRKPRRNAGGRSSRRPTSRRNESAKAR